MGLRVTKSVCSTWLALTGGCGRLHPALAMCEFTLEAEDEEANVLAWMCKEWARSTLGGEKVAERSVKECNRYVVRPGNLNDRLKIYQDVDPKLHPVAAYSVEAHLIKLEKEQVVERRGVGWALKS